MDEHELAVINDPIKRGIEAERILTSPVWLDVWEKMEQAIIDGWKDAPMRDSEGMAELKRMHNTLKSLKANLESAVFDGKIEKANQEKSVVHKVHDWLGRKIG